MNMNNLKMIGIHPATAVNHILNMYDDADEEERLKILIQRHGANVIPINELPKRFSSKQMIDIRAGEVLSLGVIGLYYSIFCSFNRRTFQIVVGVEDTLKKQIENLISDGAIWENEKEIKMPFQQTLIQGVMPMPHEIKTEEVVIAIDNKLAQREHNPDNCGLLVSVYGHAGKIDFKKIIDSCDLSKYSSVFVLAYQLPKIETVTVTMLEKDMSASDFVRAQRLITLPRSKSGPWLVNDPKQ